MIGFIIIGIILFIIVVILGTAFWRAGDNFPCTFALEKASIAIWIVGVILSLAIISTGIFLNEQAQAEYAKYDAVRWYGVLLEDEGDSALEELGESRELPDLDKIVLEVSLKEGFAAKKEALCFISKVQHHNKRYGIFSKYWLLRKKVTRRAISELI